MTRVKNPLQDELRSLLREEFTDGASTRDLAERIGKDRSNVRSALHAMADVYIDRWEPTEVHAYWRPIYCAAQIPEDCPRPEVA